MKAIHIKRVINSLCILVIALTACVLVPIQPALAAVTTVPDGVKATCSVDSISPKCEFDFGLNHLTIPGVGTVPLRHLLWVRYKNTLRDNRRNTWIVARRVIRVDARNFPHELCVTDTSVEQPSSTPRRVFQVYIDNQDACGGLIFTYEAATTFRPLGPRLRLVSRIASRHNRANNPRAVSKWVSIEPSRLRF